MLCVSNEIHVSVVTRVKLFHGAMVSSNLGSGRLDNLQHHADLVNMSDLPFEDV